MRGWVAHRAVMRGLVVLTGLVVASPSADAARNPIQGSTIRLDASGIVETLDPVQASSPAERLIVAHLFDRLVRRGVDGSWQPSAAIHWKVSADSLEWTFVLRPGMSFTDGRPVNAEAVVRSWNRSASEDATRRRLRGTMTADASGAVRLRLTRSIPDLLSQLADPAHGITAPIDGPNGGNLVGSGPFRLTRSPKAGEFVLAPRVDHRLGRPIPAGIVVTSRPEATDALVEPRGVRGVITDPTSGTLDLTLAFTDGTTSQLPLSPTTPR